MYFIVICRKDREGDAKGAYELATRTVFSNPAAAQSYADSLSPSREPIVVPGAFDELRFKVLRKA